MKILDHLASLVWLVAIAAVVLALLSPAADGQSELRMSRADAKREAVVNARGDLHVPSNYRAAYAVLRALPLGAFARVEAFCLRAVAQSLTSIAAWCPVAAGFVAPGRLLTDVSFINASGLVLPGAIRCADGSTLAFYERPEWMRAWFPLRADDVTACGRVLRAVLEAPLVPA